MHASRAARILGPYVARDKWRLVIIEGRGRKSLIFDSPEQAEAAKSTIGQQIAQPTLSIGELIELFIADKRRRGLKPLSLRTVQDRLSGFLPIDQPIAAFNYQAAQKSYDSMQDRFATATHHAALKCAKALFRFAIAHGHARDNPFAGITPLGRPRRGKLQLSIDEARKLSQALRHEAEQGDELSMALLLQLFLGLRTSEVVQRRVRDLDDRGQVLVIPSGKTEQARRRLECPPFLSELLRKKVAGKTAEQWLFGEQTPHTQAWLWKGLRRHCRALALPVVCPHSLRGLPSSLAIEAGHTSQEVASQLGHKSFAVTALHYIRPGTIENSRIRKVSSLLATESAPSPGEMSPEKDRLLAILATLSEAELARIVADLPPIKDR